MMMNFDITVNINGIGLNLIDCFGLNSKPSNVKEHIITQGINLSRIYI